MASYKKCKHMRDLHVSWPSFTHPCIVFTYGLALLGRSPLIYFRHQPRNRRFRAVSARWKFMIKHDNGLIWPQTWIGSPLSLTQPFFLPTKDQHPLASHYGETWHNFMPFYEAANWRVLAHPWNKVRVFEFSIASTLCWWGVHSYENQPSALGLSTNDGWVDGCPGLDRVAIHLNRLARRGRKLAWKGD